MLGVGGVGADVIGGRHFAAAERRVLALSGNGPRGRGRCFRRCPVGLIVHGRPFAGEADIRPPFRQKAIPPGMPRKVRALPASTTDSLIKMGGPACISKLGRAAAGSA
jgi:hypothetical protein